MPPASPTRPIRPSSASTSRTRWPLPRPPMAGLQDMAPIVEKRCVTRAVAAPIRAEAEAASQPAWPPPITMTSKLSRSVRMGGLLTHRQGSRKRKLERQLFHVKRCKADQGLFAKATPCAVEWPLETLSFFVRGKGVTRGKRVVRRPRRVGDRTATAGPYPKALRADRRNPRPFRVPAPKVLPLAAGPCAQPAT